MNKCRLLILILTALLLGACVSKGKTQYTDGLIFEVDEQTQTVSVVGYAGLDTELVIPKTYNGYPVTRLAFTQSSIETYVSITSITLPDSVEVLEDGSLAHPTFDTLVSLRVPKLVDSFACALHTNKNLTIEIPQNHPTLMQVEVSGVSIVVSKDLSSLLFLPRTDDVNQVITLPLGINKIARCAGAYTAYQEIILPESVTVIEDRAFINTYAYRNDLGATHITIPNGVTHIGRQALQGTIDTATFYLPSELVFLGSMALSNNPIKTLMIPSTLVQFNPFIASYIPEMARPIAIENIIFESFELSSVEITQFVNTFVYMNFSDYEGTIHVKTDVASFDALVDAIQASITYATSMNIYAKYPTFTFSILEDLP